jgi:hypothetical protein
MGMGANETIVAIYGNYQVARMFDFYQTTGILRNDPDE